MTNEQRAFLIGELRERFPWLVNGGGEPGYLMEQKLSTWYGELESDSRCICGEPKPCEHEGAQHWACPECKSKDLQVQVSVWATLIQHPDTFETDTDGGDHEWDGNSGMVCNDCGHGDNADRFEVEDEEEETANAI